MAATDIELTQDHAVPGPDVGHRRDHAADGLAVQRTVGDLRADVAVQAHQVQQGLIQHAAGSLDGVAIVQWEAELLIRDPRRHRRMSVDVDIGGDPHQHALALREAGRQEHDLGVGVHHDPAHAHGRRVAEFIGGLGIAVHDDSFRIETAREGGGQLAGGADIQ
ncbi:Uncharacterised protein [Mycobacteroides abscessus subsp. abscessus]|nr:Uncharacterised protein [Mycobacteroides abscessus subsp. abscessus]